MKKSIYTSILFFAFIGISLGQNGIFFEYKISSANGNTGNIKTYYSSVGSRVEIQNASKIVASNFSHIGIVKNSAPTMVYLLNEQNKSYVGTELPQQDNTVNNRAESRTVKIIGKEKSGHYNCIHSIVTEGGTASREYWTTTEIADYEKYSKPSTSNKLTGLANDYEILSQNGAAGFVIKTITNDPVSGDVVTVELTKSEKKDLNASLFELPVDYKASAITAPAK